MKIKIIKSHPRLSDEVGSVIDTTEEIATWLIEQGLGEPVEAESKGKKTAKDQ